MKDTLSLYKSWTFRNILYIANAIVILWIISPYFSSRLRLIGYFLFSFVIIIISISIRPKYLIVFFNKFKYWIYWGGIMFLYSVTGNSSNIANQFYLIMIMTPIYLVVSYEIYTKDIKLIEFNRVVFFASLLLTSMMTLYYLNINPYVSRLLATSDANEFFSYKGVGGFAFIYSLVFVTPILVLNIRGKKLLHKFGLVCVIILFSLTIFKSSFGIAVIIFVLLMLSAFMLSRITYLMLLPILILASAFYFTDFLYLLSHFVEGLDNQIIRLRLLEVIRVLTDFNLDVSSDFSIRVNAYKMSLETFINNPFFGVGAHYGYAGEVNNIGGHSEWLDLLARYGIIGSIPLVLHFWVLTKDIAKRLSKKASILFVLYCLVLGMLNPFIGTVSLAVFSLIPNFIGTHIESNNF